jgi:transposase
MFLCYILLVNSLTNREDIAVYKKYIVKLTEEEHQHLRSLISKGRERVRTITRARILLKADTGPLGPGLNDEQICQALDTSMPTVCRTRQRFVEEGLEASLKDHKRKGTRSRRLDGRQEAHLIALVCSKSPEGTARWSLRLLAEKMVELSFADSVSYETIRRVLKKHQLNLG